MCTPAIAMGTQALSAGVGAYGAYQQGLAQSKYYKYAAAGSRLEADQAIKEGEQESSFAQDSGAQKTQALKMKQVALNGEQKVALAANMGGGSRTAADIVSDTFTKEKLDELAIKYNADMESWRSTNQGKLKAWGLRRQAEGYDVAAGEAEKAGKIGAFNTLLGGAGQVANTWAMSKRYAPSTQKFAQVSGKRVPVYEG